MNTEEQNPTEPAEDEVPLTEEQRKREEQWRQNYLACEEHLTAELRKKLSALISAKKKGLPEQVRNRLEEWAAAARIANLAEWLNNGGWEKVDLEELDRRTWATALEPTVYRGIFGYFDQPTKDQGPHDDSRFNESAIRTWIEDREWYVLKECLLPEKEKDWLIVLAAAWIAERGGIEIERAEREAKAGDLQKVPIVHTRGRKYGRLPKVAAGMSWAFGGPCVELSRVELDGRIYAPAPDLAIAKSTDRQLVPAGYSLLPADHAKRPHQALLPLDMGGGEDAPPLPVALADATQYALAPASGKLGLLVMAAAHAGGGKLHKTTLRELTKSINPDARIVQTHFETVCKSLGQLDGLRLVLPNGLAYRVFECPVPWRELRPEEYDTPLFVGLTRTFERTLAAIQDAAGASYRGDFLFDLTGAMKLPTRRAGLVRQYIRAAAFWNFAWKPGTGGEPDPSRVPEVSAEKWAILTNYLPPAAAEYLAATGKGDRRRLSDSIKDTLQDAEVLAEAGLVKIARADRKAVRLLPPDEYIEAWHESRKGAHKMPGNAPEA